MWSTTSSKETARATWTNKCVLPTNAFAPLPPPPHGNHCISATPQGFSYSFTMSAEAIKKQVEFYFSDSNYRKDTFLKAAAESDPDGFVAISVLLTFNRLKSLTTDVAKIADAVEDSDEVVLSADKKKIKRSRPLPEHDESAGRSLYVKGFPTDDAEVTIDSIGNMFSTYGKVLYVKMRQLKDRSSGAMRFKGSAVIEFDSEESMKKAISSGKAEDGSITLGWKNGKFVELCSFNDWLAQKKTFAQKQKSDKGGDSKKRKAEGEAEQPKQQEEVKYEEGLVVSITNLPTHLTGIELKEFLREMADARYVDYTNGENHACVRCADADAAKALVTALAAELKFPKSEDVVKVTAAVLTGEEEKGFWVKSDADFKARRDSRHKKGGPGRGNKRHRA